jgi:hypothetical protein
MWPCNDGERQWSAMSDYPLHIATVHAQRWRHEIAGTAKRDFANVIAADGVKDSQSAGGFISARIRLWAKLVP